MSADVAAPAAPAGASMLPAVISAHKRRATPLQHTLIGGGAGVLEVCIMQPTVCVKNALQVSARRRQRRRRSGQPGRALS